MKGCDGLQIHPVVERAACSDCPNRTVNLPLDQNLAVINAVDPNEGSGTNSNAESLPRPTARTVHLNVETRVVRTSTRDSTPSTATSSEP